MSRHALYAAAAAACLVSFSAHAQNVSLHATLSGASEVPPAQTQATGAFQGTVDAKTHTLNYTLTYANLSGPPAAAHFHGPAEAGKNAGVQTAIANPGTSPVKGSVKLTAEQEQDLQAGKWYVNIHTKAHPAGELRGQIEAGAM
jgi:CHRD domain-containing protein